MQVGLQKNLLYSLYAEYAMQILRLFVAGRFIQLQLNSSFSFLFAPE